MRRITHLDRLIGAIDRGLRVSLAPAPESRDPSPARDIPETRLDADQRRHAAGLMRVNHTGEVCAQALYAGQGFAARSDRVRAEMTEAAREEEDHLAWCAERLRELDSRPSLLSPAWYAASFALGAGAGLAGDAWSLGFVSATERQVEAHLGDHLQRLPDGDRRSRAIVRRMQADEARHAEHAETAGAHDLPRPLQALMAITANVMKAVAYRI